LAHAYWSKLVQQGDLVIDATCGNGKDALALARYALESPLGRLWALDLQAEAIASAQILLKDSLPPEQFARISFLQCNHSVFPENIKEGSVKLIAYNLGYLPGGNKTLTTTAASTLLSLGLAVKLACPGGAISVTCYPGHPEGLAEEAAILQWCRGLSPKLWSVCSHRWENRKKAPSLLLLQRCWRS
jgi:hypothetical protein